MTQHPSILTELQWRGLLKQRTHEEELDQALLEGPVTLYCGFDPTSPSLHVGSLLPILSLAHFRRHGHHPVALVGGATGMIGDPSFKSEERQLLGPEQIQENLAGITAQIRAILDRCLTMHTEHLGALDPQGEPVPVVDNAQWMAPWGYIEFLRDVGKHFRVNQMMAKESVKARLEEREQGISYTEFSYMLIQAYDFMHLFEHQGCTLQIGGSDQWGNITAGTELIRRVHGQSAYGLTFPLLLTGDGRKFGKTEHGAIWLDPERTTPYEFYQYWVSQPDDELPDLLRRMTLLPQSQVEALIQPQHKREAQKRLAHEMTWLVHGKEEADKAVHASGMLFGQEITKLGERDFRAIFAEVPTTEIPRHELEAGLELIDLMVKTTLQPSRAAAKRLLGQGGVYVNNVRIEQEEHRLGPHDLISPSALVLRAGRKKYHVIQIAD